MITLNLFSGHELLFGIILILILINFICILYLVIKERKKDKEEIGEIIASLSNAKPREIEEKKEEIEKEEVEMVEEVNKPKLEIDKVLEKMQKDLEMTPEDAVLSFEQEQEEKSIISYQELVNSLKKSDTVVNDVKEMLKENFDETIDNEHLFEERLENTSKDTKQLLESDFKEDLETIDFSDKEPQKSTLFETGFKEDMQEMAENEKKFNSKIDVIDIEEDIEYVPKGEATASIQEEIVSPPKEKKKFQNTDFISPIYGKLDEKEMDYPTVPQFSRTEAIEELLDDSIQPSFTSKEGFGETLDVSPLRSEMEANDEFLKNLKDFRGNLEN